MANIFETNVITGETSVREMTQEEIDSRIERLTPAQWDALRSERNSRLDESDRYVLPDRWAGYTNEQQLAWTVYRQALRDLPQNTTDPFNPVWPIKPT